MSGRRLVLAGFTCVLTVTACGASARAQPKDFRQVVLTAARLSQDQPFRMDATGEESIGGSGALGSASGPLTLNLHFDVASKARSTGTVSTTIGSASGTANTTVYDGTVYVSTDGGVTYRSRPASAATSQYGPASALQYFEAIGAVTDNGAAVTPDGISIERYHAQLDPAKATSMVASALAGSSSSLRQVAGALHFKTGSIDVGIDAQGRLAVETGAYEVTVDAGAIRSSLQGETLDANITLNARFYDYGAQIVVTMPSNVNGTLPA